MLTEGTSHCVRDKAEGHTASIVGKQIEMDAAAWLSFLLLFSIDPQPME